MSGKSPKSPNSRSKSPKRKSADDILLDKMSTTNVVEPPTALFGALGGVVSALPAYLAFFLYDLDFSVANIVLCLFVCGSVAFMLQKAYSILFFCEYMKRDVPSEIKSQADANLLRSLRLELSMAKTAYQVNVVFVVLSSVLQLYVFKKIDPRAGLLMAPMFAALVSWFVAYKSEEMRKIAAAPKLGNMQ